MSERMWKRCAKWGLSALVLGSSFASSLVAQSCYMPPFEMGMCEPFCEPVVEESIPLKFSFGVEGLVLRPYQERLPFALAYEGFLSSMTEVESREGLRFIPDGDLQGKDREMLFRFDPGFRVSCSVEMLDPTVNLTLSWLDFHSTAKGAALGTQSLNATDTWSLVLPQSLPVTILLPTGDTNLSPLWSSASGQWSFDFDQADCLFRKCFALTPGVTVEPFLGVSGLKIKQKMVEEFLITDSTGTSSREMYQFTVKQAARFESVGIKAGCSSIWSLLHGASLYGSWDSALFWGDYDVKQSCDYQGLTDATFYSAVIKHNRFEAVRLAQHVALGLEYVSTFCAETMSARFHLGWEGSLFYHQNPFTAFQKIATYNNAGLANTGDAANQGLIGGDLSLHGWVVGLEVRY